MNGKTAVLAAAGVLNARPQAVTDAVFCSSVFFDARDLMQVKYEMVRRARADRVPVTRAVAAFGSPAPPSISRRRRWTLPGRPGCCRASRGRRVRAS